MSDLIRIRIREFYKNYEGDNEYVYVSLPVYEAITRTFPNESNNAYMRDSRYRAYENYEEGSTEELLMEKCEPLEDLIIRRYELEILHKAMQTLTPPQKERLLLYFYWGLSTREIAEITGVHQNAVWKSIQISIKKLKKFFI